MAADKPRVLYVAPRLSTQAHLPFVDQETQDVLQAKLSVTPLLGDVGYTDLVRELRSGSYEVLWLATHGDETGVYLSDGPIDASGLATLARFHLELVVLNVCSSQTVGQMIVEESGADCICTISDVLDRAAYQTGSLFAAALAESGDYRTAYEQAKPARGRYLYLTSARTSMQQRQNHTDVMAALRDLARQVTGVEERVNRRIWEIERHMTERDKEIDQKLAEITKQGARQYHVKLGVASLRWWAAAYLSFTLIAALFVKEVRDFIGVPPLTALALILAIQLAVSLPAFVIGLGFVVEKERRVS